MCTICTCGIDDDDDCGEEVEEEDIGTFEPCNAQQCSECGGLVFADLNELDHVETSSGKNIYECPHCGSWNREGWDD